MKRAEETKRLLEHWGSEAACGKQKAFVMLTDGEYGRYRLTAPAGFLPERGALLECEGSVYTVLKADEVRLGRECLFTKAVLEKTESGEQK